MTRLLNFDIAKVICIILVVIGHYNSKSFPLWYQELISWIYTFHMPLFMFASGYIYIAFKKNENYISFLTRKLKRLMIPYFSISFIIITIKLLTEKGLYIQNPVTTESYFKAFYQPEAGYFLWFVWSLFTIFLFIPLFKTKTSRLILFGLALVIHYLPLELTRIFAIHETKNMLCWFLLGVCCFDWIGYIKKAIFRNSISAFMSATTICLFVISSIFRSQSSILILLQPWLGIASVMIFSTILSKVTHGIAMNIITALSASNYIIYLFHTTFEGFAKAFLQKIHIGSLDGTTLFCVQATLVILCGIICPIILHHAVLKRFKLTKFLFGLK
ncbi:MAG: acyltransferase family protein [Candidatus Saccharibacteria bacterium]|nr:acyltransferase family protein [Candidatus Saccharibacteria bacterium]